MQKTVLHNQSLYDFAIQHFGTFQAAIDIAELNNLSPTAPLEAGQELSLPQKDYGYGDIAEYYENNKIVPATAIEAEESSQPNKYLLPQTLPLL